jgi:iron complex outermembrane receptor protein
VNAVNGVINIITKSAADTQGAIVSAGAGNQESDFTARYGGHVGENLNYRLYVEGFDRLRTFTAAGPSAKDGWRGIQGGFRMDWHDSADLFTLQGDFYGVSIDAANSALDGQNVLGRWTHSWTGGAQSEVQAYYDRANRYVPGSIGDVVNTYDVDLKHSFRIGEANAIVLGGGYRRADGVFSNTPTIFILPAARQLDWANAFVQDTISLGPQWRLTAGTKYEHSSYSGGSFLPSFRLAWTPNAATLLWSAISHAEREPSQFDRDYYQNIGRTPLVVGGNFQSEKLWAYELGYRGELSKRASLSISGFYNDYNDLRTTELTPAGGLPATFGNMMEGHTYGVEVWSTFALTDWWRVSPGFTALHKNLRLKPGSRDVSGLQAPGDDPSQWATLRSSMTFGRVIDLDVDLREVGALPNPAVPAYGTVDARLGWHISERLELAVKGSNLLNRAHAEYGALPARSEIPRMVYASFRWRP